MTLYHYTCDHGRLALGDKGELIAPIDQPLDQTVVDGMTAWQRGLLQLIWMTDLDEPLRRPLGLTSRSLRCDRTRYRYRVADDKYVHRWVTVRRDWPRELRDGLESADGAMPGNWWISLRPVPVIFDPR